jgi:hypothetical protein
MQRLDACALGLVAVTAMVGVWSGAAAVANSPTAVHTYSIRATPNVRGGGEMRVRVTALGPHAMRATFSLRVSARRATRILMQAGPCTRNGCVDSGTANAPVHVARGAMRIVRSVIVRRQRAGGVYCVSVQAYDTGASGLHIVGTVLPSRRVCPRGRA